MLMGLGAMIGIDVSFKSQQFLAGFFVNALFAGAVYGLLWSFYLALKNWQKFLKELRKYLANEKIVKFKRIILVGLGVLFLLLFFIEQYFIKIVVLSFALLVLITFYLSAFVKAVENSSMYKSVEPSKLTEGDWIVNDVIVDKQYICGPKDLGIEKKKHQEANRTSQKRQSQENNSGYEDRPEHCFRGPKSKADA